MRNILYQNRKFFQYLPEIILIPTRGPQSREGWIISKGSREPSVHEILSNQNILSVRWSLIDSLAIIASLENLKVLWNDKLVKLIWFQPSFRERINFLIFFSCNFAPFINPVDDCLNIVFHILSIVIMKFWNDFLVIRFHSFFQDRLKNFTFYILTDFQVVVASEMKEKKVMKFLSNDFSFSRKLD